jgi:hypothetical protein
VLSLDEILHGGHENEPSAADLDRDEIASIEEGGQMGSTEAKPRSGFLDGCEPGIGP